ncbi:MAG: 4Fe-4S dicluster domain-containing protein [Rhodobacteraceae bacterium]|nr:4Fe-4S dicluster domain-containing protein [Paracoccaceae bacterium]
MTRYAIVADLNRCVGCQTCTAACKHANATAPGIQWRKVLDFEVGEYPDVTRAFLPVGCMHCDDPPCMDVCPTGATRKRDDGIVTIDYDICIGCAYCAVSCPYQARFRVDQPAAAYGGKAMRHEALREDPARIGVAQKCTFCVERIDAGCAQGLVPGVDGAATPACVNSCIAGALHMGDTDDPDSNVSVLLRENRHFRMHEDLGTGPGTYYLYDKKIGDDTAGDTAGEPVPMIAEPAGLAAVSPRLQTNWDWRAAANFVLGGTGAGLFVATVLVAMSTHVAWWAAFIALGLVAVGLSCVWLEIGRPWRFLNVYLNPKSSWMSREAVAALPFFGFGGLYLLWPGALVGLAAAASGLVFAYCQGRILRAAKGIPAWRQAGIVPLIVVTGLAEGAGIFTVMAVVAGYEFMLLSTIGSGLMALIALRAMLWQAYRGALGEAGAPAGALKALDGGFLNLSGRVQAVVLAVAVAGLLSPPVLALAGLLVLLTGWGFKYRLITGAAFNQGFAINRMPARGAGKSGPGVKPGWTVS